MSVQGRGHCAAQCQRRRPFRELVDGLLKFWICVWPWSDWVVRIQAYRCVWQQTGTLVVGSCDPQYPKLLWFSSCEEEVVTLATAEGQYLTHCMDAGESPLQHFMLSKTAPGRLRTTVLLRHDQASIETTQGRPQARWHGCFGQQNGLTVRIERHMKDTWQLSFKTSLGVVFGKLFGSWCAYVFLLQTSGEVYWRLGVATCMERLACASERDMECAEDAPSHTSEQHNVVVELHI